MIRAALATAALATALLATTAQAATLSATPATLAAVARTAQACDVVVVTGPAASLQLYSNTFPVSQACPWGVTLDLSAQTLNYFTASKVSNLKVVGGRYAANDWHGAVNIGNFSNVAVEGITQTSGTTGIIMRDGTGASVQGNILTGGNIYLGGVTGFDVGYNTSIGAASDGCDLAGSSYGVVHDNVSVGANAQDGAHPDACQLFNPVGPYPTISHHIEIARNFAFGQTQGFNAWGGAANVWMHDNTTVTAYGLGAIDNCTHCAATNNHGSTIPGSAWQGGSIDSRGSPDVILCGNTTKEYAGWKALAAPACTPAQLAAAKALVAR